TPAVVLKPTMLNTYGWLINCDTHCALRGFVLCRHVSRIRCHAQRLAYPKRLQAAVVPIIDRAECMNSSRIYTSMSRSAFCAGFGLKEKELVDVTTTSGHHFDIVYHDAMDEHVKCQ
ncbi:hypothetical protein TELCIR_15747, partial [Teladorsagia circumcincta]